LQWRQIGTTGFSSLNGALFNAVEGLPVGTVATFADENPLAPVSDFTISIDWGDGTSGSPDVTSGMAVALGGGQFGIVSTTPHSYPEEGVDYPISISIQDVDGNSLSFSGIGHVLD